MTPRGNGTPHSAWSNSTEDEPTPTLTSQTFAHAQGLNATSYLQSPSESDAQDLIQKLKKAFALTRIGQESVTSSRQAEAALTALDQALDLPDKDHPFASLAPLELVPYLATLLTLAGHTQNDSQARLRNHARNSLILLVERASSAREVHHALLLRMARAGKRSAERADDDEEEELDRSAAFFELSVLIQLQADAIRRIRTKRLVPFLRAISNASKSVLQRVSTTEAIEEGRVADVTEATLLQAMAEFISSIIEMETLDSEVLDVLRDFLLFTLAQLASSPPLDAVLAETYFRRLHPRFGERLNQRNLGTQQADAEAWQTVKNTARGLKLGTQGLFSLASRHDISDPGPPRRSTTIGGPQSSHLAVKGPEKTPPPSTMGAFVLLAHLVAENDGLTGLVGGWYALRSMLPHVLASLATDGTATDEALFWVFWCLDNDSGAQDGGAEEVDEATLYPLIETVSSLAATATIDDQRFIAYRLLVTLIVKTLRSRDDLQLVLILDLLDEAPYPMLKSATVGLLRELMTIRLPERGKSLFCSPVFVQDLGPAVMRCEPADLSKVSLDQFLDDALLQANSERLGLIYSVLTADEHNRTTLRSPDRLRAVRNQLLSPIHSALQRWLSEPDSTPEAKMALNVLRCQYELCESAVARFEVHAE